MTALTAGFANMPNAALEYAADKISLGPILDAFKAGKITKDVLATEIAKKTRTTIAKEIAKGAAEHAAKAMTAEGLTEGTQQAETNLVAKALYDPNRKISEGVGSSALIGGLTGAVVGAGSHIGSEIMPRNSDDTGQNVPEARETLQAQQKALLEGRQKAQMFPDGKGELPLPPGMSRVETKRGVFHYNPVQIGASDVIAASDAGRENEILGLGPASKADIHQRAIAGEPVAAVVEKTPEGTEVKAALVTPATTPATAAEMKARADAANTVGLENPQKVITDRPQGEDFVANLLAGDRTAKAQREQAIARESLEREARNKEAEQKRGRFAETIDAAGKIFRDPNASFAQVQGALEAARFYAEDNSLGLPQEQKELAQRATAKLAPVLERLRGVEDARRDAESQARQKLEAETELAKKARIAQDKQQMKTAQAAGIGADGKLDYTRLTDDQLGERASNGDKAADKELDRRVLMGDQEERVSLRDVLAEIKLPATDEALGAELQMLKQELKGPELMKFFSTKSKSLDATAEALRERGFTQIQTPDDVVTFATRALRGEEIHAQDPGRAQVDYAQGTVRETPKTMDAGKRDRILAGLRRSSPKLMQQYDVAAGLVQDLLNEYAERGGKRIGPIPEDVKAAVAHIDGQRGLIALGAEHFQTPGQAASLVTHEVGHTFFDTLNAETKAMLAEQRQKEITDKTGPLYDKNKKLLSDLAGVEDPSEWGMKEWFAERINRLNEEWATGRIEAGSRAGDSTLRRLAYELREMIRKIWTAIATSRGIDPDSDLFQNQFREYWMTGKGRKEAGASKRAEFAQSLLRLDTPVGITLPNEVRNLTPKWQDKTIQFESALDKALYYAGGEARTETRDRVAQSLAAQTGLSLGEIARPCSPAAPADGTARPQRRHRWHPARARPHAPARGSHRRHGIRQSQERENDSGQSWQNRGRCHS
jgi:hypothetical protein